MGPVGELLRGVTGKAVIAVITCIGLCACAVVDQYAGRAVTYNLQAEQAQEQNLLLNVVRASLRRPMQFTGLQSISGTANASGTIGGTGQAVSQRPLISLFGLAVPATSTIISNTLTGSMTGSGTMSGGPTFSVPVLDTQEFYQGFLNPISGQLFDLYFQFGYPHDVLFNLMIEKMIIKRLDGECRVEVHTPECEMTIRNYAPEDVSLRLFQTMIGYLIRLGLSTEPIIEVTAKGKSDKASDKTSDKASDKTATTAAEVKQYGFCFAPRDALDYRLINRHVLCGHPAAPLQLNASAIGRKSIITGVPIPRDLMDELYAEVIEPRLAGEFQDDRATGFRGIRAFGGKNVSISFNTRSIEGILYYLGEVVRRSAHPESGQSPDPVQVRVGPQQNAFPRRACPYEGTIDGYRCTSLFVVEEGGTDLNGISVEYAGTRYTISSDTRGSWTMPVFDIVKQLQAVNTSAKNLPASNLISVLSN
jgi:hypothetical protein